MLKKRILIEDIKELGLKKGQIIYIQEKEEDPGIMDLEVEINDLEKQMLDAKQADDKNAMDNIKINLDKAKEDLKNLKDRTKEIK